MFFGTELLLGLVVCFAGLVVFWLLRPLPSAPRSMAACTLEKEKDIREERTPDSWTVVGDRGRPWRSHPLYKKLSAISGQVNALTVREVKERLDQLGLCKRYLHVLTGSAVTVFFHLKHTIIDFGQGVVE